MRKIRKLAVAGTVAAIGLGMGATTASAYSISGGSYTSTRSATHRFTVGGSYTFTCPIAAGGVSGGALFAGSATGADNTDFTPAFGNCKFLGFTAIVTQLGAWNLKVTSGPDIDGRYFGGVTIPAATSTTLQAMPSCTVTVAGPQSFSHGGSGGSDVIRGKNWTSGTGVDFEAYITGITYTAAASCPFSSGSDGVYTTGGVTLIPGITIS